VKPLGLPYISSEFPHGLRCEKCDHLFQEGERYSVELQAFVDETPLAGCLCVTCLLGNRLEQSAHAS
jgi:hypothetical protein